MISALVVATLLVCGGPASFDDQRQPCAVEDQQKPCLCSDAFWWDSDDPLPDDVVWRIRRCLVHTDGSPRWDRERQDVQCDWVGETREAMWWPGWDRLPLPAGPRLDLPKADRLFAYTVHAAKQSETVLVCSDPLDVTWFDGDWQMCGPEHGPEAVEAARQVFYRGGGWRCVDEATGERQPCP